MMRKSRSWVAFGLLVGMMAAGTGRASAEPEDEVRALLLRAENVQAVGISPTTIIVGWTDESLIETGYRVEMSLDEEGTYTKIGQSGPCNGGLPSNIQGTTIPLLLSMNRGGKCVVNVQIAPASDTKPRWFRVVPLFTSQLTGDVEGAPSLPDPAILSSGRPTQLKCNGGSACRETTTIALTWKDNSDESEFWIMRARGAANPNFGTQAHAKVAANTTTYTESNLELESTFFYKVVAVRSVNILRSNGDITVEQSFADAEAPDRVLVETPRLAPPVDPTGLVGTFTPPSTTTLTWTDNATNEDGYYVEWGPTATSFETQVSWVGHPDTGTVTYPDPTVPPDTNRCYRVRAYRNAPVYSGFSNVVCLGSTPASPTGLVAVPFSNSRVDLTWNDESTSEESFAIDRCPGVCSPVTGTWTEIATTAADTETFSDLTVVGATTYSYRVSARNSSGRSAPTNVATVTTPPAPIAPPTSLEATGVGSHAIELRWDDQTADETGFRIEFKMLDGTFATLDTVGPHTGPTQVVYLDTNSLAASQTRCYRVRSMKGIELSDPSNEDCGTTMPPQVPNGAPSDVVVAFVEDRRMGLTWVDNATNETGFRVDVASFDDKLCDDPDVIAGQGPDDNGDGIPDAVPTFAFRVHQQAPAAAGLVSFTVTGLIPHTAYFFRVKAINQDGESGPAFSTCAHTLGPPRPVIVDTEGDPETSGDLDLTRCEVRVREPSTGDDAADRIKLTITASVPDTATYLVEEVFIEEPMVAGGNIWEKKYKFRKGFNYGFIAQGIGPPLTTSPNRYASVDLRLRDMQVLADCPQDLP